MIGNLSHFSVFILLFIFYLFFHDAMFQAQDMILQCQFGGGGSECDHSQWSMISNPMGMCLTFNSKQYIENHVRLKSVQPGKSHGLQVVVNVEVDEYVVSMEDYEGIQVKIRGAPLDLM